MDANQQPSDPMAEGEEVNRIMNNRIVQGHVDLMYNVGDIGQNGTTPQAEERAWALGLQAIQEPNTKLPIGENPYYDGAADFTNEVGPVEAGNLALPPLNYDLLGLYPPTPHAPQTPLLQVNPDDLTCPVPECRSTRCTTYASLQRHIQREHGPNVNTYFCQVCVYMTKKESDLERHHTARHTAEMKFCCPVCYKGFARKDNCRRHIRSVEGSQDLEPTAL